MSQVRYQPLGPLLAGEGSRAFLGLALEAGTPPRPVVIVWAPPDVTRDPELAAGLQRETERAAVLEHPNILRVHGLVQLEAGLARVTEFADGESLRRVLEVRPRIPPAFAALIVSDVAMGIHYAHLAGNDDGSALVHGDLRPETVMVSFKGICKVAGYGALSVAPRERNGRRVRNRRNYSAPEQLVGGREAVTARTDVFLLGLLLYECLSGRVPFQEAPEPDQAVLTRQLAPLPSDVPRALAEVVRRATAKRANERYATALEMREELVAAVEGLPSAEVFAEFLTTLFPPDRDARATRRQMLEIGLLDVARRISGSGLPAVQPAPVSAPAPTPPPKRPSGSIPPLESTISELAEDDVSVDVPFEEEDADTVDSVLEITGRHARPGVARPLVAQEPHTPPINERPSEERPSEPPRPPPPDEEEDAPPARKRRSRVPLLIGALAAVAAAAGAFVFWHGRTQVTPKPMETDAALVARTTAEPEKKAPGAAPAPAATPITAPTAPAVALASGSAPATPGGNVAPASGVAPTAPSTEDPDAPAPSAAQAQAVSTRLQLFVLPPVDVSLEGKRLGRTPLTVPLAPGPYKLELSNPAKGVKTLRSITVGDTGTTTQRILLGKGTVQVKAPAGSRIFINGRKAGSKLSLYEGEHQLVVTSGKTRWEKSFRLEPRQRVTLTVSSDAP